MKVINIINLKGGVAKTATVSEMAYLLSQKLDETVLMIDNDKQGNLSKLYGAYSDQEKSGTEKLLLKQYTKASDLIKHTAYDGLDILSANMSLLSATWELNREDTGDQVNRYEPIRDLSYDYIIIDNPPDLGLNVINAIMASDEIIVPIKIDNWALKGLDIITEQIEQIKKIAPRVKLMGVLVTMYQNDDTNNAGVEWLKKSGYPLFDTCIRYSRKAAESTFFEKPVSEYSPRSAVARTYKKFLEEYIERSWKNGEVHSTGSHER